MDIRTVALNASADGLSPAPYVKDVLSHRFPILPTKIGQNNSLFSPEMSRALLHESLLYFLRSLSQIIGYEAAYKKSQFSWALVTLYYANYFCVSSLNRLAGKAISTTQKNSYEVTSNPIQSDFLVEKVSVNNHQSIWKTNYELYSQFNWHDNSYNGIIVRVSPANRDHYERKNREFVNYHPDSYKELFLSNSKRKNILSFFGNYYASSPATVALLPFGNDLEKIVANLECRGIARQIIVFNIWREVTQNLPPTSKMIVVDYLKHFSNNIMSQSPLSSKLKSIFQPFIQDLLS